MAGGPGGGKRRGAARRASLSGDPDDLLLRYQADFWKHFGLNYYDVQNLPWSVFMSNVHAIRQAETRKGD